MASKMANPPPTNSATSARKLGRHLADQRRAATQIAFGPLDFDRQCPAKSRCSRHGRTSTARSPPRRAFRPADRGGPGPSRAPRPGRNSPVASRCKSSPTAPPRLVMRTGDVQNQPADRVGRVAAIGQHVVVGRVARDALVLAKGVEQPRERLARDGELADRGGQRHEHRMRGAAGVAVVELAVPPVEQCQAVGAIASRRPGRRPSGNRHRSRRNGAAGAAAAANWPP